MIGYLPFLLVLALALWIYAFLDCLGTPEEQIRTLPKVAWVVVLLLFGEVLIGPVAWLIAGRPRRDTPKAGVHGPTPRDEPPARWVAPDDNPEFLRSLEERLRRGRNGTSGPDDTSAA